ncbi:MAG: hypothetical protein ACQCN6_11075 [Candidatus Bathyarchaeia archaeon]
MRILIRLCDCTQQHSTAGLGYFIATRTVNTVRLSYCSGYRDEYLKRGFEIRLRATGTNTYAEKAF